MSNAFDLRRRRFGRLLAMALGAAFAWGPLAAVPAAAQQRRPAKPPAKEEPAAADTKVEVEGKGAILQGLDKVTAQTSIFDADLNKAVAFGSLRITVRRCQRSRPDQKLERAAFLEIDDVDPTTKQAKRIFSGWMFSSNPALSALDHPVYDVWVKDCK
jgi:hypothetical protein